METNILNIQASKEVYDILLHLPFSQIYYEDENGCIDTRSKDKISSIYLEEIGKIVNSMLVSMKNGWTREEAFSKAIFDETRFQILEDYGDGFLSVQQLSDYLRDSYQDEDLTRGIITNDVYIR
ncbi:MAG: hypothetical protein Q4C49_08115 [Bacillota bacterium]|nr:hypothetical protein [Bacillota bacterium]